MKKFYQYSAAMLALLATSLQVSATEKLVWQNANTQLKRDLNVEQQVQQLLENMTLEQKVAQMIQPEIGYLSVEQMRKYGFGSYLNGGNTAPYGNKLATPENWLAFADEMYQASIDASVDGSTIPTIWGTDAMHGHSNVSGATLFPHNIGLGAANDPKLIKKIGQATAKEVAVTGIEWSFAPTVAVVRDDRWGRTYESYSEDPAIVKAYAGEMVAGIQGDIGPDFLTGYHRIATAKHFVGDGGTENGIDRGDTLVSEAVLRDIHAAGYFSAIEAGVQSVMASFNSWKGKRLHGDKYLLTDVLKGQMGFDGFVVSDWNAHKFVDGCDIEQCAGAINAGVDVIMVPEHFEAFYHNTIKQVKQGIIPLARIDDAVTRFLRAKVRWGLLEKGKPSTRLHDELKHSFNAPAHKALAREAVRKSLVLLKNNQQILPLNPSQNILVTGSGADNIAKQAGGWSVSWQGTDNSNADFPNATSIYAGIQQKVMAAGGKVELSENAQFKTKPDVAIMVIGEEPYAEWFGDIQSIEYQAGNKQDLNLLKQLKQQNIPVVTVFLSGRPLWVNQELNQSDAFVAAWLPGSEGQGIADVILSKKDGSIDYDFSGKLSFSWPKFDDQFVLNVKDDDYDPLFAYGFGLTYQDKLDLPQLLEQNRLVKSLDVNESFALFERNLTQGLVWSLANETQAGKMQTLKINSPSGTSEDKHSIRMQSVNLAYQEDARRFVWQGEKFAKMALSYQTTGDLTEQVKAAEVLSFDVRMDEYPQNEVNLGLLCRANYCLVEQDIQAILKQQALGKWQRLEFDISCAHQSNQLNRLAHVLTMQTQGNMALAIANVKLDKKSSNQTIVTSCQ
ncbi:glycoside hydrolase family 3 C-terminal domain-containing protein [Catenovulum sp. 2E275]|uniref:glycoside hydrolase family 3 protein n=1 Tax=Catenovulum sp. 2E275 TaxID=2980497 RepID=UPI0021CE5F66|nr:glycoside hydrolase family 3 N-terminal domain-containing protein [Catenovulum sp. 2E275]MCU4674053.1 glycoside hydrolase family 3 C-terminal domain-containing protein [Catenovulum sp. 2E275]